MQTTSASSSEAANPRNPGSPGPGFTARRGSVFDLVQALTNETKTFLRQEITLAKTELAEKLGRMARGGASIGVGGFTAYAAVIVMLLGFGFLAAWAIHLAGIESLFASFLGLFGVGLLVLGIGALLAFQGVAGVRQTSLTPERTLYTLQELKGGPVATRSPSSPTSEEKISSDQAQARVEATEREMAQTMEELRRRLTVHYAKEQLTRHVSANAYRWSLVAMVAGVVGGFLLTRKFHTMTEDRDSWLRRFSRGRRPTGFAGWLRQFRTS